MTILAIAIAVVLFVGALIFVLKHPKNEAVQEVEKIATDSLEGLLHELTGHVDASENHKQLSEDFEDAAHKVADEMHGRIANVKEKLGDILPEREHE